METNRQKKVAKVIQKDLADVLREDAQRGGLGVIVSVTRVRVTPDLTEAKAYLSIFPNDRKDEIFEGVNRNSHQIKHALAQRTRHQLRKMPELHFFIDDSLDYIEDIDEALKGEENPIENPDLLSKKRNK
jgi:ribosome-binding factor A